MQARKSKREEGCDLDQVKCIKDEEGKKGDIVLGELARSERLRDFGYCSVLGSRRLYVLLVGWRGKKRPGR
ncbi:hypothetical protein H5410_023656 [Solanum commersonii]|uniref:Uncharacterized protein n=1 Tax=Solanum commersonii TaxID=4109 RepID=A0A9J5ZJB5_SOLCO|nr:hypothetical protein H5410_023656 [Solanum commersonii]